MYVDFSRKGGNASLFLFCHNQMEFKKSRDHQTRVYYDNVYEDFDWISLRARSVQHCSCRPYLRDLKPRGGYQSSIVRYDALLGARRFSFYDPQSLNVQELICVFLDNIYLCIHIYIYWKSRVDIYDMRDYVYITTPLPFLYRYRRRNRKTRKIVYWHI